MSWRKLGNKLASFLHGVDVFVPISQTNMGKYFAQRWLYKNFIRQETMNKNRQELPVFYRLNGAIYLAYCNYLKKQRNFIGEETFAL